MLTQITPTIRTVAQLVGNMVATKEAIPLAPLYYRNMENDKNVALKCNQGDFDKHMFLSPHVREDIHWWLTHLPHTYRHITPQEIMKTLHTDASKQGWGASDGSNNTKGRWLATEWEEGNINLMELKEVYFALQSHKRKIYTSD